MAEHWEVINQEATSNPTDGSSLKIDRVSEQAALMNFLCEKGLQKYAQDIVHATDAECLNDLASMDEQMIEQTIQAAGLKVIPAKKFQEAVLELRLKVANANQLCQVLTPTVAVSVTSQGSPLQCVAVCIDRSGSMGAQFSTERTRMEAVKQMFYAFRDRTETVGSGRHQLGLIQFDNVMDVLLTPTFDLQVFEEVVDKMAHRGSTAIYSAIIKAVEMLKPAFAADPETDLHIMMLTDGQNNCGAPPTEALAAARSIGAVVDAIIVGSSPDSNLRKIVSSTGGECFQIFDMADGFELLESERVVSLLARRGDEPKPSLVPITPEELANFDSIEEKTITKGMVVAQPSQLPALAVCSAEKAAANATATTASERRVKLEITNLTKASPDELAGLHIFPSVDDVSHWRVLMEGPSGTPFEGGTFLLQVHFPSDYPFKPPRVKFETPVYHCNINDAGGLCLDILKDNWSPALTALRCLRGIRALLNEPNTYDALRQWIAELTMAHIKTNGADTRYADKVKEEIQKHASTSVEQWKNIWGC